MQTTRDNGLIQYCVGFTFNEKRNAIVLIQKNRPKWQRNKFNGVGGRVQPFESPTQAMVREFEEETGYRHKEWDHFLNYYGDGYVVYFFRAFDNSAFAHSHTKTDESIFKVFVETLDFIPTIPNLRYLARMALDKNVNYAEIHERESSHKPQRSPGVYY